MKQYVFKMFGKFWEIKRKYRDLNEFEAFAYGKSSHFCVEESSEARVLQLLRSLFIETAEITDKICWRSSGMGKCNFVSQNLYYGKGAVLYQVFKEREGVYYPSYRIRDKWHHLCMKKTLKEAKQVCQADFDKRRKK